MSLTYTITINNGVFGANTEASECQIAELIVYNRTLNSTEYASVESYLASKYGL